MTFLIKIVKLKKKKFSAVLSEVGGGKKPDYF